MLSIMPYERTDRDSDRPFKTYPRVSVAPASPQFYGHYSASAFVGRHPPTHSSGSTHRGALDLTGMDLRHGMPPGPLDGPHMTDMGHVQRDHHGHHMTSSHMGYPPQQQTQGPHDTYLGRAGQPAPLPNNHHGTPGGILPLSNEPPLHGATGSLSPNDAPPSAHSPHNDSNSSSELNGSRIPPKKRPLNVPEDSKDNMYWEKRKKNNESAKRSRDSRRMKEEQIAMRVVYLEQENLQLRTEVSLLKNEIEKLRCMLYNS